MILYVLENVLTGSQYEYESSLELKLGYQYQLSTLQGTYRVISITYPDIKKVGLH